MIVSNNKCNDTREYRSKDKYPRSLKTPSTIVEKDAYDAKFTHYTHLNAPQN